MDLKKYIESGILEEFVFGTLSPEEMIEVQDNATQYPEIQQAIDEISLDVVPMLGMSPSADLLDEIMADLPPADTGGASNEPPTPPAKGEGSSGYPSWMLLLLSFLLIGSLLLNMWYWNESEKLTETINEQETALTTCQTESESCRDTVNLFKKIADLCAKGNITIPLLIAADNSEMNDLIAKGYIPYHVYYDYNTTDPTSQFFFRHPDNYDVISSGKDMVFNRKELYAWAVISDGVDTETKKLGRLNPSNSLNLNLNKVLPPGSGKTVKFGISLELIGSNPNAPSEGVRVSDPL